MDKYILSRFLGFFMLGTASEIGVARVAWEGDDIADVGHTGDKQHKAFEAETKAGVWHGAEFACIQVPPHPDFVTEKQSIL